MTPTPQDIDRRGFAKRAFVAVAGLFGLPGLATVADPVLRSVGGGWSEAAAEADVKEGAARRFVYEVAAGWEKRKEVGFLVRKGKDIVAFSARCTHLGCKVRFKDSAFRCPCHQGVFDLDGQPQDGPVEKPLERFETRVENGKVQVKT